MTFNLNETTAQRIDDLNLANRSEWANGVFLEVMDDRLAQRQGRVLDDIANAKERAAEQVLDDLADNPTRLAAMLLAAMQRQGSDGMKVKGRYTIAEQLTIAIQINAFRAWANAGDEQ